MFKIKLPALFETSEAATKADLGLDLNLNDDSEIRDMIFYTIDSIEPYLAENEDYSIVNSGGQRIVVPMTIVELEYRIDIAKEKANR